MRRAADVAPATLAVTKPSTGTTSGAAALAAAGIAENEIRPEVLTPLAGRSPDCDRAIVARLAREPSPECAAALHTIAAAAETRGWKAVVKDVRRALYRFEQRGTEIPPAPAAAPRRARVPGTNPLEGYLSPVDGRGDRLVWLVRARPGAGLLVMTAVLNEPAGLRDVAVAEMPRKTLRRMTEDMRNKHHLRIIRVDGAYVDALLAQGFTRARAAGTPGTGEYPAYRARMTTEEPAPLAPPLLERIAPSKPEQETGAHVATLLGEPELMTWVVEPATLAPYLAELGEARDSPLVLSSSQQQDRVREVVTRAIREIFATDTATAYQRRLEEMAYYFHATGRPDAATAASASAAAIARTGSGEGVLLIETIMQQSVARLTAEEASRTKAEESGNLIVKPSALRTEQAPEHSPLPTRRR